MGIAPFSRWAEGYSKIAGGVVLAAAAVVLLGWTFHIAVLKNIVPTWPKMSPITASCFVLSGISLLYLSFNLGGKQANRGRSIIWRSGIWPSSIWPSSIWLSRAFAGVVLVICTIRLLGYITGHNPGIDYLWFHEAPGAAPASMSPATAGNFFLSTCALLLASLPRLSKLFQVSVLLGILAGWLGFSRYIFGGAPLLPYTQMAIHTALCFLLLTTGIFSVRRDIGLMALLGSDHAGGVIARFLVPPALAVPTIVGWTVLRGEHAGWYGTEAGLSLFALVNVMVFGGLIWAAADLLQRIDLQRLEAEEEVRASQKMLFAMADNSTAVIYVKDLQGRYLMVNRCYEDLFHVRREEMIGKTDYDLFPKEWADAFRQVDQQVAREGRAIHAEEVAPQDDGTHTYLSVKYPLSDKAGQLYAVCGISTDITERKQSEVKLQTHLKRLNLLDQITRAIGERQDLRSIFQAVIRRVEDSFPIDFGCICLYDPASERLTVSHVGTSSEALAVELAMSEQTSVPIDENGLSRCVRGQLVYEPDISLVGFPFPQRLFGAGLRSLVIAPLLFESSVFGVFVAARKQPNGFASDDCEFLRQLSEHVALAAHQVQIYSALRQAYDDLRQTQQVVMQQERLRALGQMASGIAHDINNAITPVSLYTDLLLQSEANLSPRLRQYLEITQRSMDDVAQTIARMRDFYRQRESQLTLTAVDLSQIVQQVLDLTRVRLSDIPQKQGIDIELKTELAKDLPLIDGIESEIREACLNLIFNAVDAMPEGGTLTLVTQVTQSGPRSDSYVKVEITDTGVGMDEETRRRCLEPFFTTKGERGTGLGLAMVYGMAQRHGTDIEIESKVGVGTTVRMYFPVPIAPSSEPSRSFDAHPLAISQRILIVDDDPLIIKSLFDTLEREGHRVTPASGGQEGIDMFKKAKERNEPFDFVITDLGMPYVDGRKVASSVKELSPSTPVILLTGWGQRLMAEGDFPVHVDRILSKPAKLRDLRIALAELVANRKETPQA